MDPCGAGMGAPIFVTDPQPLKEIKVKQFDSLVDRMPFIVLDKVE